VHIINLFVAASQNLDRAPGRGGEMIQGFSVQEWTDQGLRFIAISDIGADELQEFRRKFAAGAIGSN
jgi:anti-sigma factor RsiW